MILIVDNYDSFVHNLARYLQQLCSEEIRIVRNDACDLKQLREQLPSAIVLSPGPCGPAQAGVCLELVGQFMETVPILGVCLGHQVIVQSLGGLITVSAKPMHGKPSQIIHQHESRLFAGIPSPFPAGRYHSLFAEIDSLPPCLRVTAQTSEGTVMAVEHRRLPLFGVQFHPESVLTEKGYQLLANFLAISGIDSVLHERQQIFA